LESNEKVCLHRGESFTHSRNLQVDLFRHRKWSKTDSSVSTARASVTFEEKTRNADDE